MSEEDVVIECEEKTYFRVDDPFLESNNSAPVSANGALSVLRICYEILRRWGGLQHVVQFMIYANLSALIFI